MQLHNNRLFRHTPLMIVLGIMSGTSIDGVDYALCRFVRERIELVKIWSADFPADLKRRLNDAASNQLSSYGLAQLHHDLGRFYATAAQVKTGRVKPELVGLHGQTIFHNPDRKSPATMQIGEPIYLAERFRIPVINNFRVADLAAGGQGAPFATMFHLHAFAEKGRHICVNNLGGISNVTSIDWRQRNRPPKILSFDTGPANLLIDQATRTLSRGRMPFDRNGAWAKQGTASIAHVRDWLKHPFFKQAPPKSTGRELFGEPFLERALQDMRALPAADQIATLTEFSSASLALNYRLFLPPIDRVILAGGGARNPVLVTGIRRNLAGFAPQAQVLSCAKLGWPVQTVEPAAFALLAWLRWNKKPGNLPQTTGAKRPVLCGQITEP